MFADELLAYPEAKPGSDNAFGGKERLEDLMPRIGIDSFTAISYRDADVAIAVSQTRSGRNTQLDRALVIDCVQAIGQQIGKDLPQFSGNRGDLLLAIPLFFDRCAL